MSPRSATSSRALAAFSVARTRSGLAVTRQEVVHPGRPGESSGCQVITHPDQEAWMNIHKNARLTPYRRQELVARVERGEPVTAVARAFGVSRQTARKWMLRKRDAGMVDSTAWAGDGSSRPAHSPRQTAPKRSEERRVGKECRSRWSWEE